MNKNELTSELIHIIEQSMTLARQDLVNVRNDLMLFKVELEGMKRTIEDFREERIETLKLKGTIIDASIAAFSSLLIAAIHLFKS